MFRILDRYIFKETAQTWISVTGVLLVILLSNQFARVLGDAARDKIAKDAVFNVIGLTALQYLTILIPFGLFLAAMLSLARLYSDSELPAMMACRVGPSGLIRPLAWLAIPLTVLVAWLALVVAPQSLRQIEIIGAEAQRQIDLGNLEAGRFIPAGDDGSVIFADRISESGELRDVFLHHQVGDVLQIVLAERGVQRQSQDGGTRFIVLYNGRRYEGIPGSARFQIIEFAEYGVPFSLPKTRAPVLEPEAMSTTELLGMSDRLAIAELQWRLSVPLSTMVLALLAVPLSRTRPRQGRYGRLAVGVLVFIIYFNMMGAAKVWVERGQLPSSVGIWAVHAFFVMVALVMFANHNGVFRRILRSGRRP